MTEIQVGYLVLLACTSSVSIVHDENVALKERFLREAPPKWTEFERRALVIKATIRQDVKAVSLIDTYTANDTCRMVLRKRSDSETSELFTVNPDYAFWLKRKTDSTPWILANIELNEPKPKLPGMARLIARDVNWPHSIVVRFVEEKISEIVSRPEFKIISIRPEDNSPHLVRLDFECPHELSNDSNILRAVQAGSIVLDPARYWSILGGRIELLSARTRGIRTWKVTLDESTDLPLPGKFESVEDWFFLDGKPSDYKPVERKEITFDHKAGVANPNAFRLPAFGIPEPPEYAKSSQWTTIFWVLNATGLVLVLSGLLYIFWRRASAVR